VLTVPTQAPHDLALVTFVFPDSSSSPFRTAPSGNTIPIPYNSSAEILPCSTNPLSPISHDTTLAFSMPYTEAPDFLAAVQEIRTPASGPYKEEPDHDFFREDKKWIMKAVRTGNGSRSVRTWASNAWTSFVDLLKVGIRLHVPSAISNDVPVEC